VSLKSPEVVWQPELPRERRYEALGQRGATLWFTGLPSSGKSTIAAAVQEQLLAQGRFAYLLDGDNLRHGLCGDLGFSLEDRAENVRRAAHAARLLADAGVVALASLVSPYAADRALARDLHERNGIVFLEVFVATPLALCEQRDPKGLYARARSGELRGFTGVDDPYEPPEAPDVLLCPEDGVAAAAARVVAAVPQVF
jgi:adenylyl-sulfate kinase